MTQRKTSQSQREGNYKGGIQAGTTAFDEKSKKLDKVLKQARNELVEEGVPGFRCIKRMSPKQKVEYVGVDTFGFEPDGGLWIRERDNQPVAAFEGKKQGVRGNACERWYKNAALARQMNPNVIYRTFLAGAGANPGEVLDKMATTARTLYGSNYDFHASPDGFTVEEAKEVIKDTLKGCK